MRQRAAFPPFTSAIRSVRVNKQNEREIEVRDRQTESVCEGKNDFEVPCA